MRSELPVLGILAACLLTLPVAVAQARVFRSQREALKDAFPQADRIEKKTSVLNREEATRIERLSRAHLASRLVTIHTAWREGRVLGYAEVDVHRVRTQSEALLIVLDASGGVRSVKVLAFYEPPDYLPTKRWYDQFVGKKGGESLRLGRGVDGVTGATLSSRAATSSVRRMLAYYRVLLLDSRSGRVK